MTNTPYAWLGSFELVEALETPVYHTADFAVWGSNREEVDTILAELQFEKPWGIHRVVSVIPASQWPTPDAETEKLIQGVSPKSDFKLGGTYPLPTPSVDYLTITEHNIPPLPEQKGVPFWEKKWITPELKTLLFGQPDAEQPLNTYLVVDATLRKEITGFFDLDSVDVPVKCLFTGDAAEELKEVAPYLIDLTLTNEILNDKDRAPQFHRDFFEKHWDKGTGIVIRTTANMYELHHHLRKFTQYENEQGKRFFFRFWETNCSYDYFSQVTKMPERAKRFFQLREGNWIESFVSYSEKMGRLYTIEPQHQQLRAINITELPFSLTPVEQQALMNGVLRPYALIIQHNVMTQYADYFANLEARELEERIMAIVVSMHAYGFHRLDYLQTLVEQGLFFGRDFVEKDYTGRLLNILTASDDEDEKYQRLVEYLPKYEEMLMNTNEKAAG